MEPLSKTRERRTATPVARYSTTSTTSIKKPTMKQTKGYVAQSLSNPPVVGMLRARILRAIVLCSMPHATACPTRRLPASPTLGRTSFLTSLNHIITHFHHSDSWDTPLDSLEHHLAGCRKAIFRCTSSRTPRWRMASGSGCARGLELSQGPV